MGRGVVAANCCPPLRVDLGPRRLTRSHESFSHRTAVDVDVRCWLEGIIDVDQPGVGPNPAGVPNLATRLPVERRAVQDHLDRVSRFRLRNRSIRADEPDDPYVSGRHLIAEELGRSLGQIDVELSTRPGTIAEGVDRSTPTDLTLRGERLLKPDLIDFQTLLAGQ